MKKVITIALVLSMLSVLFIAPMSASAAVSGDFTYEITDGKATVTGYTGSEANLTIPAELGGCPVTKIGDRAFLSNSTIQIVTLPDSVEELGVSAFNSCSNLQTVVLSKNLKTIGNLAFQMSSLTYISLPDSITYIGTCAFVSTKLTYINLPASIDTINDLTFAACQNLAYVRIPHTVTTIAKNSFSACKEDLLTIVGCANSAAQAFAEEKGFTFATIPCKDHTFSSGACVCCGVLLGDLNKDNVVNMDDYNILIGYVNDPTTCPELIIADVNQDGVLDINDRLFLLEIISGYTTWPE